MYLVLLFRKLGTVLEVSRDAVRNPTEGSSGPTVFTVKTLLGELTKKAVLPIKIRGKCIKKCCRKVWAGLHYFWELDPDSY
jgi:hypothetical protein